MSAGPVRPALARDEFIAWQCKLRRQAMRGAGGRPSEGMRPRVLDADGELIDDALTVLLARDIAVARRCRNVGRAGLCIASRSGRLVKTSTTAALTPIAIASATDSFSVSRMVARIASLRPSIISSR